jgi:hypothetical protein
MTTHVTIKTFRKRLKRMAASKVSISDIPKDVLGDLQALTKLSKKEYIPVGSNIYAIEPAPATVLMESMGEFSTLLENLRKKKVELAKAQNPDIQSSQVEVFVKDLIYSSDSGPSLSTILEKLLQGVEKSDLDQMNIGQMIYAIDKAIKMNLDTLPASFRDTFTTPKDMEKLPEITEAGGAEISKNPSAPDTI